MKYTKLLSLSLILVGLLGCNQPPSANQVINPIEEETSPAGENSNPPIAINNQAPQASQTKNNSSQTARVETTNKTQKSSQQIVAQKLERLAQAQNSSPQKATQRLKKTTQTQNTSSKYATVEELKELDKRIRKRNGRIIGSASCDGDGIENDYRVDFDGDGMPDECVTANFRAHRRFLEDTVASVRDTLNYLEKGSQVTSIKQGNLTYYLWKKDGEIIKAIKAEEGSATSLQYWFDEGKTLAVQRIEDRTKSTVKNTIFTYHQNGQLYSIVEVLGGEGDNSKYITNFSNQQLQESINLVNGYQEIFNVFGAD